MIVRLCNDLFHTVYCYFFVYANYPPELILEFLYFVHADEAWRVD